MRTLKEIRLVYRQHLLPPLIVPFEKLSDYKKVFDSGRSQHGLGSKVNDQMNNIMQEINETVITQIIKIRSNYIVPLEECPFYYEKIDQVVRKQMTKSVNQNKSYQEVYSSITPV